MLINTSPLSINLPPNFISNLECQVGENQSEIQHQSHQLRANLHFRKVLTGTNLILLEKKSNSRHP